MQGNPYVGPRPFTTDDEKVFFGRTREIADLKSLVSAHPIVLLYAESGAGKSSLINAGLVPRLQAANFEVMPAARVRGSVPADNSLENVRNIFTLNVILSLENKQGDSAAGEALARTKLTDYLLATRKNVGEKPARILILDQFEELFTSYAERWQDRDAFFMELATLFVPDVAAREEEPQAPLLKVLIVMREDYVAHLDRYRRLLPGSLQHRFRLERLRKEAAIEAIKRPAESTECSYDAGAAELLVGELLRSKLKTERGEVAEVVGEFVEPVQLQVVCHKMWSELPAGTRLITEVLVNRHFNVDNALAEFYETTIHDTASFRYRSEGAIRRWFEEKLITPNGTRGTVFEGEKKTEGMPNPVVRALDDAHLLRGDWRAGGKWYEITHDRFIGPILGSNREWRRRRRRVYFIGAAVAVIGMALLSAYLVLMYRQGEQNAARQQANAFAFVSLIQTVQDRLSTRPDIGTVLSAAAFASRDSPESRAALLKATTGTPELYAYLTGDDIPIEAVAAADANMVTTISSTGRLQSWDLRLRKMVRSEKVNGVGAYALSRTGEHLLAHDLDGNLEFSNLKTSSNLQKFALDPDLAWAFTTEVALSGDGRYAAVARGCERDPGGRRAQRQQNCHATVRIVDGVTRTPVKRFALTANPTAVALSGDGSLLAVGECRDSGPEGAAESPDPDDDSQDGNNVTQCRTALAIYEWRKKQEPLDITFSFGGIYEALAFSSSAKLAAARHGVGVQLYASVAEGGELRQRQEIQFPGQTRFTTLAYDDEHDRIIAGSNEGVVIVFDMSERGLPGFTVAAAVPGEHGRFEPSLERLALSEQSTVIATAEHGLGESRDSGVYAWMLEGGQYKSVLAKTTPKRRPYDVAIDHEGTRVAVAFIDAESTDDGLPTIQLWSIPDGREVGKLVSQDLRQVPGITLPEPSGRQSSVRSGDLIPRVSSIAFCDDGSQRVLLGTNAGDLLVWQPSDHSLRKIANVKHYSFGPEDGNFASIYDPRLLAQIAFSPSGKRFVAVALGGAAVIGTWGAGPRIDDIQRLPSGTITLAFGQSDEHVIVSGRYGLYEVQITDPITYSRIGAKAWGGDQIALTSNQVGRLIAISRKRVSLIDASNGAEIGSPYPDMSGGVTFGEGGKTLFVAGGYGRIMKLDMNFRALVDRACNLVSRNAIFQANDELRRANIKQVCPLPRD